MRLNTHQIHKLTISSDIYSHSKSQLNIDVVVESVSEPNKHQILKLTISSDIYNRSSFEVNIDVVESRD